jgi:hypothetical protein
MQKLSIVANLAKMLQWPKHQVLSEGAQEISNKWQRLLKISVYIM